MTEGYASWARPYARAGWELLPLPYGCKEAPPRGFTGRDRQPVTEADMRYWARQFGDRSNCCVRAPEGLVGIDVDAYKSNTMAALSKLSALAGGSLPATYRSSARPFPSGIYWYRCDFELDPNPAPGVETVQWFHRYGVVHPSLHPDVRAPYHWSWMGNALDHLPDVEKVPLLGEAWTEVLVRKLVDPQPVYLREQGDEPEGDGTLEPVSGDWGWAVAVEDTLWAAQRRMGEGWSRHEEARNALMALVGYRQHRLPGTEEAIEQLRESFLDAVGSSRPPGIAEIEWSRMMTGAESKTQPYGRSYKRTKSTTWRR